MNEHVNFEEEEEGIEKIDFNERFSVWFQAGEQFFPEYKDQLQELGVDVPDEYWGTILSNLINIKQKMEEQLAKTETIFSYFLYGFNEENGCELTLEMLRGSKRSGSEYYDIAEKFLNYMLEADVEELNSSTLNTCTFLPLFIEVVEKLITEFDSMESEDLFDFVDNFFANGFTHLVISDFEGEIICRILDFIYPIVSEDQKEKILGYLNSLEFGDYGFDLNERCYSEAPKDISEATNRVDTEKSYLEAIWDENGTLHDSYVFLATIVNAEIALYKNLFEKYPALSNDGNYNYEEPINKFTSEFNNTTAQIEQNQQNQQKIPPLEIDNKELGAK